MANSVEVTSGRRLHNVALYHSTRHENRITIHHWTLFLKIIGPECGVYFSLYTGIKNNVFWDMTQQKFISTSDGSAPSISKFHHTTTLLQETKSHGKNEE